MGARVRAFPSALVRPAVALVGRLRYAQKFFVVAVVLFVPVVVTAHSYIAIQRSQISSSVREQQGLEYLRSLLMLNGDLVQARRAAVSRGYEHPVDLLSDINRVDKINSRLHDTFGVSARWATTRQLIIDVAKNRSQSKTEQFRAFQNAGNAVLNMIIVLGDTSGLIHDPDLDSNYLAEVLQYWLPTLCDVSGRIADLMELAGTDPNLADLDVFMELGTYFGMVSGAEALISHAADTVAGTTADRELLREIKEQARQLATVTRSMGERLSAAVAHRSLNEFPSHSADAVRVAATGFASVAVTGLDRLLQTRIEQANERIRRILLFAGVGAALAVYLFIGFYLSVASPVRNIVAVLRAVAGGDLTRRARVDTRDELSFVATVLNETIATTQAATERLAHQATRDSLTTLPNRTVALDRLEHALARSRETGDLLAVFFIDLDRFKLINDSLGHDAGDEVLRIVAARLATATRASDTLARLAGDEFVVISEGIHEPEHAVAAAERIVATVGEPVEITVNGGRRELTIGASIGVAFADGTAEVSPGDLLRDADVAMYRAKQRGRSRVDVFDESLSAAVEYRLQTQQELRRAIDGGELVVYYQPIVDTLDGRVVGFEALVRWNHPTRGLLTPNHFIDIAEDSGLIVPLGASVLNAACRQAALWRAERPADDRLRISVNVSAAQFGHPAFVPTVAAALESTGLDPDALWLEITETSVLADVEAASATLGALRELGVHLALDDFGTGYSSLTYLRQFPVQVLKIDRSFVNGLGHNREDSAIVEMIVNLARTLDLLVIAEGVETQEHVEELRRLGCSTCQGYHLGRPGPAETAWQATERTEVAGSRR